MTQFPQGPSGSPGFLLWRVTLSWQRAIGAALHPLDLTHVQFVLLACTWWLGRDGCIPNQVEVAAQAGSDVKMASEVLRKLEAKGYVHRAVDPSDTRARQVTLTAAGAELTSRALGVVEAVDADFFSGLDDVTSLLKRLLKPGPEQDS